MNLPVLFELIFMLEAEWNFSCAYDNLFFFFFKCAILSPAFKVREFSVTDAVPFPISLVWSHDSEDAEGYVGENNVQILGFNVLKKMNIWHSW